MKQEYLKLHTAILLAGLTGVFGKLILVDEYILVLWRTLLAGLFLIIGLGLSGTLKKVSKDRLLKFFITGSILGIHWVAFYGSIIKSNISIGVICFSLCGFFSAVMEPFILKKKLSIKELILGAMVVVGISLIFTLDTRYRLGIAYGIVSAMLASLYTILNKKWTSQENNPKNTLAYQLNFAFLTLLVLLPLYCIFTPVERFFPNFTELAYLTLLSSVCTIIPYMFTLQVLKKLSAFTVNLSFNLEPIYSIIIAFIFFGESRVLNYSFYLGIGIIIVSVLIQSFTAKTENKSIT